MVLPHSSIWRSLSDKERKKAVEDLRVLDYQNVSRGRAPSLPMSADPEKDPLCGFSLDPRRFAEEVTATSFARGKAQAKVGTPPSAKARGKGKEIPRADPASRPYSAFAHDPSVARPPREDRSWAHPRLLKGKKGERG